MGYLKVREEGLAEFRRKREKVYSKVIQKRKNETPVEEWRRELAGLEWVTDFLLETPAYIENCLYDGRRLIAPKRAGDITCINASYDFGYDVPFGAGVAEFSEIEGKVLGLEDFKKFLKEVLNRGQQSNSEEVKGPINFNLYVMALRERKKQILQCPKCLLAYCIPLQIDINKIRKNNPMMIG